MRGKYSLHRGTTRKLDRRAARNWDEGGIEEASVGEKTRRGKSSDIIIGSLSAPADGIEDHKISVQSLGADFQKEVLVD